MEVVAYPCLPEYKNSAQIQCNIILLLPIVQYFAFGHIECDIGCDIATMKP